MIISAGDIETKDLGGEMICASVAYSEQRVETYRDFKSFFRGVFHSRTECCYFHFGGKYDFLYIISWLLQEGKTHGYTLRPDSFFEVHGRIIGFKVNRDSVGRTVAFRDSYALLPTSLESLATSLLGKHKIAHGGNIAQMSDAEIVAYCESDASLLYECLLVAMRHFKTTNLSMTLASQALAILLEDKKKLPFEMPERPIYEFEKGANFGGHVDVYRRFAAPVYSYDISSCYPASAIEVGCPAGKGEVVINRANENKCGTYYVTLRQSGNIPCAPVIAKTKGRNDGYKLYFPTGQFKTYVTDIFMKRFPEAIVKVHSGVEYDLEEGFFTDYMQKWFAYRKVSPAHSLIGKLLMNNLLGKFAIGRERDSLVIGATDAYIYLDHEHKIGRVHKWIDFAYSCPTVNSRVTECGRIMLAKYQALAGDELLYSDTDSVKSARPIAVGTEKKLGALGFEAEHERGYFLCPKVYGLYNNARDGSDSVHAKGAMRISDPQTEVEDQYNAARDEKGISEQDIKDALYASGAIETRGVGLESWKLRIRSTHDLVQQVLRTRVMQNFHQKRKLLENEIDTRPYHVAELNLAPQNPLNIFSAN